MRATLPTLAVLALALTGCDGGPDSPDPAGTTTSSPPSSPSASATASSSPTPTTTPTAEPPTAAPAVPVPEPVPTAPVAPPAAPAAAPLPDPASFTPGEHCATYAPVSPGEVQLCNDIVQGFIDPVTGASIEQAPPAPPTSPEDADPADPGTWQGVDENGSDWAVIGPPPPGV